MNRIVLSPYSLPIWPEKCAVCCGPATNKASASSTKITGYYVVAALWQTANIDYPVCTRHKVTGDLLNFADTLGAWFPFVSSVFILVLWGIFSAFMPEPWHSFFAAFGIVIGFLLYTMMFKPVMLTVTRSKQLLLKLRNDEYAKEFLDLNFKNQEANGEAT